MTTRAYDFLRRVLWADAASCVGMGLMLAAFSGQASAVLSLPADLLRQAGIALLPFAAFVGFVASREAPSKQAVWIIVALNALWAIDSVLLLFTGWVQPNVLGMTFVVAQALFVAAIACLEYVGLGRAVLAIQR